MERALVATALCAILLALGVACLRLLTRWSLEALSRLHPLSWEAVEVARAFAWGFTAVIALLLAAAAVILALVEAAWRVRLP